MIKYDILTYNFIIDLIENTSAQINEIYDICPHIFLIFNQNVELSGSAITAYRISDMAIELHIPHNFIAKEKNNQIILMCMLIHEYCHYIEALTMSGRARVKNINDYNKCSNCRRLEERRNWTATKKLAKKLGLWNKLFYTAAKTCQFTTALRY